MKLLFSFFLFHLIVITTSYAQNKEETYKELSFEVEGKRIEYLSFEGTGEPLIWVMDLHNYFNGSEEGKIWIKHLKSLSKQFSVYVLIRPGYSEEEFDNSVFSIPKQTDYLKSFIEHLGVNQVHLYSKFPGNQDLMYMAENHPNLIRTIIFQGSHLIYPKNSGMVMNNFLKNFYAGACDLQDKAEAIITPRLGYTPEFLLKDMTIQIPLLILRLPGYDDRSLFYSYLEAIEGVSKYHFCGNTEAQDYFKNLANSPEDLEEVKKALADADRTHMNMEGIQKTFGKYVTVVDIDLSKDLFEQSESTIIEFVHQLK